VVKLTHLMLTWC